MEGRLGRTVCVGDISRENPVADVAGKTDGHSRAPWIQPARDLFVLQARYDHVLAVQHIHDGWHIRTGQLVDRAGIELASGYAHGSLQAGVTAGAAASSHGQRQKPDTRSETHQNTICPRRVSVSAASVVGDPSEATPSALRLC